MFEKTIPLFDAIFLMLCLIPLIYLLQEKIYRRIFIFALVLLLVSALFETHISGSYRHRMNGIFLLLPLVVLGLNKLLADLNRLALKHISDERSDA
jgi:asparagine N-glycosylation enzyme membrane subunit Stt3